MITIKEFSISTRELFGEVKASVRQLDKSEIFVEKYLKLIKWVDEIGCSPDEKPQGFAPIMTPRIDHRQPSLTSTSIDSIISYDLT